MKQLESFQKFGINLGLDRIEYLLEKLDNPHLKFKSIHVAGTNGKGSVCAMLSSILKESGLKVGMYTSPHLFKYNERIQIRGQGIGDREIVKYFKLVKPHAKKVKATIFEILTAMAFKYFADKKVDIAVVEVGMGGRFDATNVLTPEVSVITTIDYDHTEYLGKTLKKIAYEKAGIIKQGVPVVVGKIKKEALAVIKKIAKKNGSRCAVALGDVRNEMRSALCGPHQRQNAAVAVKAIELLKNFKVTNKNKKSGLRKVEWPGRFQIVSKKPFIIVDGAHNKAGILSLKGTIKEMKIKTPLTVIFGAQKTKDIDSMIKELRPIAKEIIVTQSSHPDAIPGIKIRNLSLHDLESPILVCGSIFLVADFLRILYNNIS